MNAARQSRARSLPLGDTVVDGLLYGVMAGLLMAAFLVLVGITSGQGAGDLLGRFDVGAAGAPVRGALVHLAVSGVYGTLFGLLWWFASQFWHDHSIAWLLGPFYGLVLFLFAEGVILPGSHSAVLAIPLWQFGTAHLVYGLVLGILMGRRQSQGRE